MRPRGRCVAKRWQLGPHAPVGRSGSPSAAGRSGGCSTPMPSNPGGLRTGSSPAPHRLLSQRPRGWTCRRAFGTANPLVPATPSSGPRRRPASQPASAAPPVSPAPGRHQRVEFEDDRGGARRDLAAWDVGRGDVMGRCEPSTGLEPVGRWVRPVRAQAPYRSADRVLWVVDHGSAPRGQAAVRRLMAAYPHAMLVQTPGPASWLHHVDIDCSLVQRTVLTPKDVARLVAGEQRLRLSEDLCH
jgi:hypothetical protein